METTQLTVAARAAVALGSSKAEAEAIRIKKEQDEQFAKMQAEREELARQRAEQAAAEKKSAEQLIIESANKRHAEAVGRTKQAAVIADSEPDKLQAASQACDRSRPVIQDNAEMTKPVSAIGIEPIDAMRKRIFTEGALREQIYDLLCEMRVPKLELVLHYCERVITERQAAAPPTHK